MATPDRESIDAFISITGSSELIAIQKLTEHGGGLNEAVNSFFTEGESNIQATNVAAAHEDFMNIDDTHRDFHESHHHETASRIDDVTNTLPKIVPETCVPRYIDKGLLGGVSHDTRASPSAPGVSNSTDYDLEEEMIQAAIEASKCEAEIGQLDDLSAEVGSSETRASKLTEAGTLASSSNRRQVTRKHRLGIGSSSVQDETEAAEEQPLVRRSSRRVKLRVPSGPTQPQIVNNYDEWEGFSSEEHDEVTIFGGVSEEAGYRIPYAQNRYTRNGLGRTNRPYTRSAPRPPSPTLTAQRLIREQQNNEYLASLQADREKELLEQVAREAAMEEEKRKLEQEKVFERQLTDKETSLPQEPAFDEANAVTLLVRMPDGRRRGRRFMKTDKLQYLFDFIDVGRVVKPSTYRLVRPYPRRAFNDGESELTLNEIGLTSKQEALFLELI